MVKKIKSFIILDRQCAAMLAAPRIGHDVIYTVWLVCTVLVHFFTVSNDF
jgi:hypothetical protein